MKILIQLALFSTAALLVFSYPNILRAEEVLRTGALPYSNQWVFDQSESYLYLSLNNLNISEGFFASDSYSTDFGTPQFRVVSLDHFLKLFNFANPEGESSFKKFSLWFRYSIGIGSKHGSIYLNDLGPEASENAYVLLILFKLGPAMNYHLTSWLEPYIGINISPYFYRQTSALSGGEAQGFTARFAPYLGAHLPLFFDHKFSLYGEISKNIPFNSAHALLADSVESNFGIGLVF